MGGVAVGLFVHTQVTFLISPAATVVQLRSCMHVLMVGSFNIIMSVCLFVCLFCIFVCPPLVVAHGVVSNSILLLPHAVV